MKYLKNILKCLAFIPLLIFLSCNPLVNESQSNSLLIVSNLLGTDLEGNDVNYLQSDVVKVDEDTGQEYVTADSATVTFEAKLMNPDPTTQTSQYNDIIVDRYIVSYSRTHGNNTPGVDVPYPFEGSLNTLVEIGTSESVSFIVVREVAKLETPLLDLKDGRGNGVLQVTATIDFYGHDLSNNTVKATGYLNIFFANYIDE
ncbi:MAG: hypothetical protein ACOC5F_04950 [Candidatus Aminicenantaceae bacterium]